MIDAKVAADPCPETAGELRASVGDDVVRNAVLPNDVREEESSQFWRVDVFPARQVNGALRESINDHHDFNLTQCCRFWLIGDEIHGQPFPGPTQ